MATTKQSEPLHGEAPSSGPEQSKRSWYEVLGGRHGGANGKLIASAGNNPYHPKSPYGRTIAVLEELVEKLSKAVGETPTSNAETVQPKGGLDQTYEHNERVHKRWDHAFSMDAGLSREGVRNKAGSPQPGAQASEQRRGVIATSIDRLLKRDPQAQLRLLDALRTRKGQLFELLAATIRPDTLRDIAASITQRRPDGVDLESMMSFVDKRRKRLAQLIVERGKYVIPLMVTPEINLQESPVENEPHVANVADAKGAKNHTQRPGSSASV